MSDDGEARPAPARPAAPITLLGVLAGLSVAGGAVGAVLTLVTGPDDGAGGASRTMWAAGCLVLGAAAGCAFWVAGSVLRHRSRAAWLRAGRELVGRGFSASGLEGLVEADPPVAPVELYALTEPGARPPIPPPAGDGGRSREQQLLRDILEQLQQLNENLLMSPEQRRAKLAARRDRLKRDLTARIEEALEAGRFDRAEEHLAELAEKVSEPSDHQGLRDRLTRAREASRQTDVEACTRQVHDLLAVSAFDRAEARALELRRRHPDEPKAAELIEHVRRESRALLGERHDRLYRDVERLAEGRQWRAALTAARHFLEAFPDGLRSDAVRAMLPTMEDNARIEEVREIRDRIRDLIERRRYREAVDAAEDVIRRFPATRAAEELKRQLGRLEELARSSPTDTHPRP